MATDTGSCPSGRATHEPGLASRPGHSVGVPNARTEQALRDKFRFLLVGRGKPTEFARAYGLCDETVLAFLSGRRPPADKLLGAMGYRREYVYSPCPCFTCTARRTDLDPGAMQFGVPIEMQRMFLCETCGNKRCPHASNHIHACTNSNEPGQKGSPNPTGVELTAEVERLADSLADQSDEPWPHGTESARLHYWRDKAIKVANELRALLTTTSGGQDE